MDEDAREKQLQRDLQRTVTACVVAMLLGVIGVAAFSIASEHPWSRRISDMGTSALIACASMLLGAMLGFLFGIPRSLQQADETRPRDVNPDVRGPAYRVNTNLEQISDWLTKILVGVGLTQLTFAPSKVWSVAETLARGFDQDARGASVVVCCILVHFSATGFFFGYLLTRLFLTGAFQRAEDGLAEKVNAVERDLTEVKQAAQAVNERVEQQTVQVAEAARDIDAKVTEGEMFRALYEDPPGGFDRVIRLGEKQIEQGAPRSAPFWTYLAAGYGQAYAWELEHDKREDRLAELRTNALKAVRKSLELDPAEKGRLNLLWRPGTDASDQDLSAFADDVEFAALLE